MRRSLARQTLTVFIVLLDAVGKVFVRVLFSTVSWRTKRLGTGCLGALRAGGIQDGGRGRGLCLSDGISRRTRNSCRPARGNCRKSRLV